MKPHRNEFTRLRMKYWRAMRNIGRARTKKRKLYWQHEVKRMGGRLMKLARQYPPLPKYQPPPVSLATAIATVRKDFI